VESVDTVAAEPLKAAPAAPTPESEIVAAVAAPAPVVVETVAPVESEPVKAFEAVETEPVEAPAPAVQLPAQTQTHYAQPSAEPVAPAPAPVALKEEALKPMLESAGLVWVNTDADKLRAAREAAAQAEAPTRAGRERKPLPPVEAAPMQQVETGKDAH
jgi:ribonuclease E